jgi:hypothetical protein
MQEVSRDVKSLSSLLETQREKTERVLKLYHCLQGLWETEVAVNKLRDDMSGKSFDTQSSAQFSEYALRRKSLRMELETLYSRMPPRASPIISGESSSITFDVDISNAGKQ